MTLPASGEITYDEINIEVGNSTGTEASMNQMVIDAINPTGAIEALPDNISDWYSFTQGIRPDPPTDVVLVWIVRGSVLRTSWTDASSDETGFEVQKFFSSTPGWEACCTTGVNGTTCDCTGLTGKTYTTRVRALGDENSVFVNSNDVNT